MKWLTQVPRLQHTHARGQNPGPEPPWGHFTAPACPARDQSTANWSTWHTQPLRNTDSAAFWKIAFALAFFPGSGECNFATKCLCARMPGACRSSWTLNHQAFSAAQGKQPPRACAPSFDFPSSRPRALGDWRGASNVWPNANLKKTTRYSLKALCPVLASVPTHNKDQTFPREFPPFSNPRDVSVLICPPRFRELTEATLRDTTFSMYGIMKSRVSERPKYRVSSSYKAQRGKAASSRPKSRAGQIWAGGLVSWL